MAAHGLLITGYLVIEGFASQEECKQMMHCMEELVSGFDPSQVTVFSTKKLGSTTWITTSMKVPITFPFFKERAFDEQGHLKQPKEVSINKVGHALHEQDPQFKRFSESSRIVDVLMSLNYKKPVLIQSIYKFKQPGIGGEVVPHQDSTSLYSDPPSVVGLWLALEDATQENGCLWALPKSHKGGLKTRYLKYSNGSRFVGDSPKYDYSDFVPLEVKAGSLVLLHESLVHQSFENKPPKSRHAYSIHAFESDGNFEKKGGNPTLGGHSFKALENKDLERKKREKPLPHQTRPSSSRPHEDFCTQMCSSPVPLPLRRA